MSVFSHTPESHLRQDDVVAAGLAASIEAQPEPDRSIHLGHLVGLLNCMACSVAMIERIASTTEGVVRAAQIAWSTDIALDKHHDEFDGDAVLSEVLAAGPELRKGMVLESMHVLAHQLADAQKVAQRERGAW